MPNKYAAMDNWSEEEVALFKELAIAQSEGEPNITAGPMATASSTKSHLKIVAEGDSWFDYKISADLIDCLRKFHGYKIKNYAKLGDTLENMKALAKKVGYKFPYVQDATSDVAVNFGAKKTPDVFLFDSEMNLAYQGAVGEGGRSVGDEIWLKDALDALVAGDEVENSQTKAVGCSIKFR